MLNEELHASLLIESGRTVTAETIRSARSAQTNDANICFYVGTNCAQNTNKMNRRKFVVNGLVFAICGCAYVNRFCVEGGMSVPIVANAPNCITLQADWLRHYQQISKCIDSSDKRVMRIPIFAQSVCLSWEVTHFTPVDRRMNTQAMLQTAQRAAKRTTFVQYKSCLSNHIEFTAH